LLHIEEDVTSQLYGSMSSSSEVKAGKEYLEHIAESLRRQGLQAETVTISHSSPRKAIIEYGRKIEADLLVMGAHGHKGLKDLIFGSTINAVRHGLNVPLLIVRAPQ